MPIRQNNVFVGIGGNLSSPRHGRPEAVMVAALDALSAAGMTVQRRSRWYRSAPVPASVQPWFVNGVVEISTSLSADALLAALHAIEAAFGRVREDRNAARILDLDLLAYGPQVIDRPSGLQVPHPRMHLRTFVLVPLAEVAPEWRHPRLHRTAAELLAELPPEIAAGQCIQAITEDKPVSGGTGGAI